jgi:hypothetical protein
VELYHQNTNTPSWRGAQLNKAQGQLYFTLTTRLSNVSEGNALCNPNGEINSYKNSIRIFQGDRRLIRTQMDDINTNLRAMEKVKLSLCFN